MFNTLVSRLTVGYASAFILLLSFTFIGLLISINSLMDARIDSDLSGDIEEFRQTFDTEGLDVLIDDLSSDVLPGEEFETFIRLFDARGNHLFSSDLSHWTGLTFDPNIVKQLRNNGRPVITTVSLSTQNYPTRQIYSRLSNSLVIQVGESLSEKNELASMIHRVFLLAVFVTLPLASLVSWLIARKAIKGINDVCRTASEIERGRLDKRVVTDAREREINNLAQTFNAMLDRIHALIMSMREMTDNIAHDMRSPLARIRVISESVLSRNSGGQDIADATTQTIEECDRLLNMINTALDVTEAEAGALQSETQLVDLTQLIADAKEIFQPVADEKNICLLLDAPETRVVLGNIPYLQRMLANLVENALKYTAPGGAVKLAISNSENASVLTVSDNGIGISERDIAHVFERFFRCDQSRRETGFGLGLSFANAVARLHGGEIRVSSVLGVGSTFTVILPHRLPSGAADPSRPYKMVTTTTGFG